MRSLVRAGLAGRLWMAAACPQAGRTASAGNDGDESGNGRDNGEQHEGRQEARPERQDSEYTEAPGASEIGRCGLAPEVVGEQGQLLRELGAGRGAAVHHLGESGKRGRGVRRAAESAWRDLAKRVKCVVEGRTQQERPPGRAQQAPEVLPARVSLRKGRCARSRRDGRRQSASHRLERGCQWAAGAERRSDEVGSEGGRERPRGNGASGG